MSWVTASVFNKNLTFPEDTYAYTGPAVFWLLGLRVGINLCD